MYVLTLFRIVNHTSYTDAERFVKNMSSEKCQIENEKFYIENAARARPLFQDCLLLFLFFL